MTCGRSAMLMLTACILPAAHTRGSQMTGPAAISIHRLITGPSVPSIAWPNSPRWLGRATFSGFTPWRGRLKSVIEQAKPKMSEACEIGSANLPSQLIPTTAVDLVDCHSPTRERLRC